MKKITFTLILIFSCLHLWGQEVATTISGQSVILNKDGTWKYVELDIDGKKTFRKVSWGCSKEDVKSTEDKEIFYETDDAIFYKGTISGLNCTIIYIFANNMLVRGRYYYDEAHSNKNSYIDDYQLIKKLLIEKYGNPNEEEQIWKNDLYKDDYSGWGMAISLGHMYYYANWKINQTNISDQLYGDNYEVKHIIDYTSIEFGELEDEIKKAKAKEDL
jgi:hypothetical protein